MDYEYHKLKDELNSKKINIEESNTENDKKFSEYVPGMVDFIEKSTMITINNFKFIPKLYKTSWKLYDTLCGPGHMMPTFGKKLEVYEILCIFISVGFFAVLIVPVLIFIPLKTIWDISEV